VGRDYRVAGAYSVPYGDEMILSGTDNRSLLGRLTSSGVIPERAFNIVCTSDIDSADMIRFDLALFDKDDYRKIADAFAKAASEEGQIELVGRYLADAGLLPKECRSVELLMDVPEQLVIMRCEVFATP
jgi:hypothetical protein